jgi:hypothetical protein
MATERNPSHGVMEGKGSYNRHATLPADGAALALPLLKKAVGTLNVGSRDERLVIADYGSSQGKNSLVPIRLAIGGLRKRIGPDRAISVFHIDQPSNDFNSLFEVLGSHPDRYVLDDPNVYPAAIGKSFYERVLPDASVHLGWSSYAAVWMSRVPSRIPGHFIGIRSTGAVRTEFDRQSARDWRAFLTVRARELRPGGRLVVVLPGIDDSGSAGIEPLFDHANAALEEMVVDGAISADERFQMTLAAHPRRRRDLFEPFDLNGTFQQLRVEDFAMSEVADGAWLQYDRDGDKDALATKRALFFRSVFVPSLAGGLRSESDGSNSQRQAAFADELEHRLKRLLTSYCAPIPNFVQTVVLAKTEQL